MFLYIIRKISSSVVDSILAQTFTDFELLLIDDGYTDRLGKICDEYAVRDNRVRVYHRENAGISSVRNLGIKEAKGNYIGWGDSDDSISVNMYEILLEVARKKNTEIRSFETEKLCTQIKNEYKQIYINNLNSFDVKLTHH